MEAVNSDGKEFIESSGGKIIVTNKGSMTGQAMVNGDFDSSVFVIVAVVAVITVAGVVVFLKRKKKSI